MTNSVQENQDEVQANPVDQASQENDKDVFAPQPAEGDVQEPSQKVQIDEAQKQEQKS